MKQQITLAIMTIALIFGRYLAKAQEDPSTQPYYPSGSGEVDSTLCPKTTGYCSPQGDDAFARWDVEYDPSTGLFNGFLITTKCPPNENNSGAEVDCTNQTLPDPTFLNTPSMLPLLGTAGYSLKGVLIYSPFEAGFSDGFVCDGGSCEGGFDLETCEARLTETCDNHTITNTDALLDDCSGHAKPYHIHKDLVCDYNEEDSTYHSPLVGIMLDGRGLYGMYENENGKPTDLDDCGGHYGPVPSATLDNGTEVSGAAYVYHYHTQDEFPFTIGCFGPLTKEKTCEDVNEDVCGKNVTATEVDVMVDGVTTTIYYKQWCLCKSSNPAALVATGGSDTGYCLTLDKSECLKHTLKCRWANDSETCVYRNWMRG